MRIDILQIHNFKNFSNADVNFDNGVNLFVGSNGSGKTSILEAINVAAGAFFGAREHKLQRFIRFDEIKITDGLREPMASVSAWSALVATNPRLNWARTIRSDTKNNDTKNIITASQYGNRFFQKFNDPADRTVAPLIAYYSTQRLFKDAYLSGKQKYDPAIGRANGYLQCLKENAIKGVLNEWLGNAVTRRATLQIKEINNIDQVLENVEETIRLTLSFFLDLPVDFPLKIYQDPDYDNELIVNYDSEHDLPLSYYSDGFRNLIYLLIDLIWRASQLNPWLDLEGITNSVFGVVTIDEIDLHLHPKWQAKAIAIIQRLLPNVQFFVTTHSPTVVANFEKGTLYVISDNEIIRHESNFFGKQVNNILRNILGATDRHKPTQDKLDRLFWLIEENKPEEYNPLLQELIDLLDYDDSEINKALSLIAYNEVDLEEQNGIH